MVRIKKPLWEAELPIYILQLPSRAESSTFDLGHFTVQLGFAGERCILEHYCKERWDQGLQGREVHVELMFVQPVLSFLKHKGMGANLRLLKSRCKLDT